jgi:hypothetical protein
MSPPPPIDPDHLRQLPPPTPGQTMHPTTLFLLHQVDLEIHASSMRSGVDLRSGFHRLLLSPSSHPAGSPPCACCACLRWSRSVCIAGGSAECGAPGGAAVKTSPGSPWPAARALPCHAVQACTWASGELVSILLFPSSLFYGYGYWPSGHDQCAKLTDILM